MVFLVWGSMAALGLIVMVPNLSVDYGVLRAFQQTLLVVAPVMAMGMWFVLPPQGRCCAVRAGRPAGRCCAADRSSGSALANAGTYYDRFFATDSAMQGISWLGATDRADRANERIIANRNVNVRLLALSDNRAPVSDRLYPTMLSRDAYVFVDGQILDQGQSTVFYTGDLLTYTYPVQVLDRHLDLIYSAPRAGLPMTALLSASCAATSCSATRRWSSLTTVLMAGGGRAVLGDRGPARLAGGRRPRRLAGRGRRLAGAVRPAGPEHRDRCAPCRPARRKAADVVTAALVVAGRRRGVRAGLRAAAAGHLAAAGRGARTRRS